jgi:hypothetical protein
MMGSFCRLSAFFIGAAVVAIALCSCGRTPTHHDPHNEGAAAAHVGDRAITEEWLRHWVSIARLSPAILAAYPPVARGSLPQNRGGSISESSTPEATLAFLAYGERVVAEAAEDGVTVSQREAKAALSRLSYNDIYGANVRLPDEARLRRRLAARSETAADKLWVVTVMLAASRLAHARAEAAARAVPRSAALAYYKRHIARFITLERRDVEAVMSSHWRRIIAAKRELEAGQSFAHVIAQYNEQIYEGGIKLNITRASLGDGKKRFEKDFFAPVRTHVLIGPHKEILYYLYEVTRIVKPRQRSFSEVEGRVRRLLVAGPYHGVLVALARRQDQRWPLNVRRSAAYLPG